MWKTMAPEEVFVKIRAIGYDGGKMVPWNDLVATLEAQDDFRWYVVESERKPDSFLPAEKNLAFLRACIARV